ncbi:hypothetical protein FQA39_LY08700 [Lamprigera yunnana]|nr:hypothetical protein FQA39_LY08700 [Lamprigera yunnana]
MPGWRPPVFYDYLGQFSPASQVLEASSNRAMMRDPVFSTGLQPGVSLGPRVRPAPPGCEEEKIEIVKMRVIFNATIELQHASNLMDIEKEKDRFHPKTFSSNINGFSE